MKEKYIYGLRIADISFALETEQPLTWEEAFLPFRAENGSPRYTAVFRQTDRLPPVPEEVFYENPGCRVHPDGKGGFLRSFYDRSPEPYGVRTAGPGERTLWVDYLERGRACVSDFSSSFFHIGLESLMIHEHRICFHAALVRTKAGGILFCGPSGIGKSTQAELWCREGLGSLINGDRPILGKRNGIWTGWGSPYAGSSKCYVNQSCPLAALVLLEQAPACSIRRPGFPEAFRRVFYAVTVNPWNPGFLSAAMDLAEDLAKNVPVFVFACTPEKEAVTCLRSHLERERIL